MNYYRIQILLKVVLAISLGIFALVVGFNNILSAQSNYPFVAHVLSMDTMQPWFNGSDALFARAITNTNIHFGAYILIICAEILLAVLFFLSAFFLIKSLFVKNVKYLMVGKAFFIIAAMVGLLLWYLGFSVIGGEYFSMWANKFDGLHQSYTFSTFILLTTIFVQTPEVKEYS